MPLLILGAAVIAVVGQAVLFAPAMRERAERLKAEQIQQENRELCDKLGIPQGSDKFGLCAGVLSEARHRLEERLTVEAMGTL